MAAVSRGAESYRQGCIRLGNILGQVISFTWLLKEIHCWVARAFRWKG